MSKMCQVVCVAIVAFSEALSVGAADYTWQGGDGQFSDTAKWSPAGFPGAGDRANFSTAADGTVKWTASVSNNEMQVVQTAGNTLTLDLGGNTYTVTNRFYFDITKASSYAVVSNGFLTAPTNTCEVKVNQGVAPARLTFGSGATVTLDRFSTWRSDVNVQSGAVVTCNNECKIGDSTANTVSTLNINGGTLTNNSHLWINGGTVSTSVLNVASGNLLVKGYFSIGNVGSGTGWGIFNLSGGYLETQGQLWVGNASNTRAIANISGGKWVAKTQFELSHGGGATSWLNMNGGEISMPNSGQNFFIANCGNGHNTTGTLSMVGGRIAVTNGSSIMIGNASNGLGRCYVGGTAEVYARDFRVGSYAFGRGECTVTGGLIQVINNLYVADVSSSVGWMRIDGGTVTNLANTYVANLSGSTGRMELASGSLTVQGNLVLGNTATNSGTFAQSNGILTVKGTPYVGYNGAGSLTIAGGMAVFSNTMYCGYNAGSTGYLALAGGTVTGVGAEWGSHGMALVEISGGSNTFGSVSVGVYTQGTLRVSGGSNTFANLQVARNNVGSSGAMTVSGGQTTVSGYFDVGQSGPGLFEMVGGELTTAYLRICPGTTTNPAPPLSEIRITGGRLRVLSDCYMPDTTSVTGRLTLAGGAFVATSLHQWWGKLHVVFDGGTLEATKSDPAFINNLDWWALTANGLVMDTAGFSDGTSLVLPDAAGVHGQFVKKGAGVFTLYATNTFTGPVVVKAGELALGSGGLITLAGGCQIDGGALLNLSARTLDFTVPTGSVSRVDGELRLAGGKTLTVANGATLSGTGVVGRVAFESGAALARNASAGAAVLQATQCAIPAGAVLALSGYTAEELRRGIVIVAGGTLSVAQSGSVVVTLNGVRQPYVALRVSGGVLTAYSYTPGTLTKVL